MWYAKSYQPRGDCDNPYEINEHICFTCARSSWASDDLECYDLNYDCLPENRMEVLMTDKPCNLFQVPVHLLDDDEDIIVNGIIYPPRLSDPQVLYLKETW